MGNCLLDLCIDGLKTVGNCLLDLCIDGLKTVGNCLLDLCIDGLNWGTSRNLLSSFPHFLILIVLL